MRKGWLTLGTIACSALVMANGYASTERSSQSYSYGVTPAAGRSYVAEYNSNRTKSHSSTKSSDADAKDADLHECSWEEDTHARNGSSYGMGKMSKVRVRENIAETIMDNWTYEDFARLIRAGNRNIIVMLESTGPYTVFAPTDAAFDSTSRDKYDALMKPQNRAKLGRMLKMHIVKGCYSLKDLKRMRSVRTVSGVDLTITMKDGDVYIDGVRIDDEDIRAANGVIHGVNKPFLTIDESAKKTKS